MKAIISREDLKKFYHMGRYVSFQNERADKGMEVKATLEANTQYFIESKLID